MNSGNRWQFGYKRQNKFKYENPRINSVLEYYQAIIDLTNSALIHIQESNPPLQKFSIPKIELNENLDDEVLYLIKSQQHILAQYLEFDFDSVKSQIEKLQSQAINFQMQLNQVNRGTNSLLNLMELETTRRPSFEFVAKNLTDTINNSIANLDFVIANRELVENLLGICRSVIEDLSESKIDCGRQIKILKMTLRLIEFMLKRNPQITLKAIEAIQKYKDALKNPDSDLETIDDEFLSDLAVIVNGTDDEKFLVSSYSRQRIKRSEDKKVLGSFFVRSSEKFSHGRIYLIISSAN